jgi:hypothetical protein
MMTVPKSGYRGAEKPSGRVALEQPYARANQQSKDATWRSPTNLHGYLHEFRQACDAEHPGKLHGQGVESEQGATVNAIASAIVRDLPLPVSTNAGGSHLGGPRWTHEFRAYLTAGGSPFATYTDDMGEEQWAYPLRSSIKRLDISGSRIDRSAAEYLYLLRRCRGHHREAWAAQVGILARDSILDVADAWATESLRRWWARYVERPLGRVA